MIGQIYSQNFSAYAFKAKVKKHPRPHPAKNHETFFDHEKMQYRKGGVYFYTHRPNGRPWPELKDGEILNDRCNDAAGGVYVLPIIKKDGKEHIVLRPLKRPPVEGIIDVIIELPGGGIGDNGDNNTIEQAAKAEIEEEIGYKPGKNGKLTVYSPMTIMDPASQTEIVSYVKATGLEEIKDKDWGDPNDPEEKEIMVGPPIPVPVDEIYKQLDRWTKNGIIINGQRRSCIVATSVYAALGFLMKEKFDEKNKK